MSLSEELSRLDELRQRGVLSDSEFAQAKARLIHSPDAAYPASGAPLINAANALRRSSTDRWLSGVCGGLARSTGVESWIWRLGFTLLAMLAGSGVLVYLLLWVFVPTE